MMLTLLLLAAAHQAPVPVALGAGSDHYFGADAYTNAEYLHLQADGRYFTVDVQHMYSDVDDTGRWRVDGAAILLESDLSVRKIPVGDFYVYMSGPCGPEVLPELRKSMQTLRDLGKQVDERQLEGLKSMVTGHPHGRGKNKGCRAQLIYSPDEYPAPPFPAQKLEPVIRAIDAWLADADAQRIFEYRAWDYRGERFLVPVRPGMTPTPFTETEVREMMDENGGKRAPYVYYAITAEDFAREANCTYAFKFHTEMNSSCNDPTPASAPGKSADGHGADPAGD